MNNEIPPNGSGDETPLTILRDQEFEPSEEFLGRLRRSIHRRTTVKQVATFSWDMPKTVLMEMAGLLGELVSVFGSKSNSRTGKDSQP